MHRPKPLADEAVPSGNGIAALALQRLGFLLAETRYLDAAERSLRAAWKAMEDYPHGHVSLLTALQEYLDHPEIIKINGEAEEVARWRDAASKLYAPSRLVFGMPGDGETVAYRCKGLQCDPPVSGWRAFTKLLKG